MSDGSEGEQAGVADEARRRAREAEARAGAGAEQIAAEAQAGELKQEELRQLGVIYGGLIGVSVVMVQPFLSTRTLDDSARVSSIAFAVAIPLLAAPCWSTGRRRSEAGEPRRRW